MAVQELGGSQSGLILPTRNGFLNRAIFITPGPVSLVFPSWVNFAKVAIIGGGGGGAIQSVSSGLVSGANGGAGGGFSQKVLTGVSSLTLTGVVGAAGLGGSAETYTSENPAGSTMPGGNGGTTTLSVPGLATMSATGGQGGSLTVNTSASGGLGAGGDVNFRGGLGGRGSASGSGYPGVPGGGGASGSPRGDGGRGGNGLTAQAVTYGQNVGSGGGWGGQGADTLLSFSSNQPVVLAPGGSSLVSNLAVVINSSNSYNYILGARGSDPLVDILSGSSSTGAYPIKAPQPRAWWDLEDVGGWSGGYYPSGVAPRIVRGAPSDIVYNISDSGDGAGGSAAAGLGPLGGNAGFGGGGCGFYHQGGEYINRLPGGVGGGGGGMSISNTPVSTSRGNNGGPGCIIVWY